MPEIGEVARVVHYIRKHLVNKTLTKVTANVDEIVYGKVGTSAAEFEKNMLNKKVVSAGQQGKYFWMIMSSPPHPVMHLGMSGWFKFDNEHTYYYRKKDNEDDSWPPKYAKFTLEAKGSNNDDVVEAALVDARRLARIRLVNCDGKEIRNNTPLKENGPDPVIDNDIVTLEWLNEICHKKKVPIKAMLLNQAVISGIGNWVGDEIMYHAKMHPEQYANTLTDAQIKQLHESLHYVCKTACDNLADAEQYPKDWLFKHRWGKGKKDATKTLPNGNKIVFLTVGGRTSAVVPAVQKKTGPAANDEDDEEEVEQKPKTKKVKKGTKRKAEEEDDDDDDDEDVSEEVIRKPAKKTAGRASKTNGVKAEAQDEPKKEDTKARKGTKVETKKKKELPTRTKEEEEPIKKTTKTAATKTAKAAKTKAATTAKKASESTQVKEEEQKEEEGDGRRRSGRLRK